MNKRAYKQLIILQPPYPTSDTVQESEKCMAWMKQAIAGIQPGKCDFLVLPEYSNCPGLERHDNMMSVITSSGKAFCETLSCEAIRIGTTIAAGAIMPTTRGLRNRGIILDSSGKMAGHTDKVHITDAEKNELGLVAADKIDVINLAGLRIAFAICFDMYFADYFTALAKLNADLIVSPSYQRSEIAQRLRCITQTRAIDSGAWVIRSSYAIESTPGKAGYSMIVSPSGEILAEAGESPGIIRAEFDPGEKFFKPASHGKPQIEHRKLLEKHRRAFSI